MPSIRVPLALIALLALAGCAGLSGSDGSSPTAGGPTTTGGTESPQTAVPTSEAVDYRDLPEETKRAFQTAVEDGSVVRDAGAFDGLPREEVGYVR